MPAIRTGKPPPPPQTRETYDEHELKIQRAVAAAAKRPNFIVSQLAREFECDPQRLRRRLKGGASKKNRQGGNKKLSDAQEGAVKKYLLDMQAMGASMPLTQIEMAANHFLEKQHEATKVDAPGSTTASEAPVVSSNWARRYVKRNPDLTTVVQKPLSTARAWAQRPEVVAEYFNNLRSTIEKYGITPENIWNMDETGFRVGIGGPRKVVVSASSRGKNHYLASESERETVTLTECINGAGSSIPPMITFKCDNILAKFCRNDLPAGTLFNTSESGYVSDIIQLHWAEHFHKRSLNHRRGGVWRLLLVDGHGSHATVQFIEYMQQHQIIVIKMPAHLTHLLQPLDLKVFSAYKKHHKHYVNEAATLGLEKYDKTEFLNDLNDIRKKTFKPSTIASAWKEAGIIPWNPDMVIAKMMSSEVSSTAENPSQVPSTPTRNRILVIKTPTTIRTLQRTGDSLSKMDVNDPDRSPLLEKFVKGSLQNAYFASKLQEDYDKMRNRKDESSTRRTGGGRHLVPGGPVTAGLCRDIDARQLEKERQDRE
jgi:hypothetical protein